MVERLRCGKCGNIAEALDKLEELRDEKIREINLLRESFQEHMHKHNEAEGGK